MTIRDYNVCANQLELTKTQKADFFVNTFGGSARTFFFESARDEMTYDRITTLMIKEYDCDIRQLSVHSLLGLRLEMTMV